MSKAEPRKKIVVLFGAQDDGTVAAIHRNFAEFLAWATDLLGNVPPEHRDAVEIEIVDSSDGPQLYIYYYRDETATEIERRLAHAAEERAFYERAGREQYERLKAKYG